MDDWINFIKDIKPLESKKEFIKPANKTNKATKDNTASFDVPASNGVDGSTQRKFNKEKFNIQATLDLHGYTYDRAFNKVISFIKTAYSQQRRCILIITGKGEVLRNELPKWLENTEIKNLILSVKQPSQSLGGSGAFMILIKRIRS